MIGLYYDTLIISHKFSNMLSILNELTLQKELHNFETNNVFLTKKQKHKIKHNQRPEGTEGSAIKTFDKEAVLV